MLHLFEQNFVALMPDFSSGIKQFFLTQYSNMLLCEHKIFYQEVLEQYRLKSNYSIIFFDKFKNAGEAIKTAPFAMFDGGDLFIKS